MHADWLTLAVVFVLFLSALVRSALGFGDALIAVPLLALVMPVEQAAPITVLVSITIAVFIFGQDWRHVHFGSAGRLILWSLPGIPIGLWIVKSWPEGVIKGGLGLLIAAFSLYSLASRRRYELKDDARAWIFGLLAGVLGGAYGMNGPPLAVYGAVRRWPPERFRATLQAYFLPASVAGMAGYWMAGLWTPAVSRYYGLSVPGVLAGIFLGRAIHARLPAHRLAVFIYAGLAAIGALLFLQAAVTR